MTPPDEIKTILDRIAATGVHTEADRTALLNTLRVDGKGNVVVQIGKYNVHIEQGQDIQIGDRISYEGPDAEAIRQTIRQMVEEYRLRPGIPFQAPSLPDHFVPRPEVADVLKARLLADRPTTPGILVVSAIHGLGGIGKSTLTAALAYDPEVQRHFKDGILWATLGQQPDLLSLLSGWVQVLGDYDFRPTTVEAASAHLHSLLHDKAALLVVDDAWDPAHPGPFRVGGARCQVVITTRETLIAHAVGATLYDLDVMTPVQALALLAGRLRRDLTAAEREQALSLAKAVGYLPLALELAAAQVADGLPWAELLADLQAEIARLASLDLAKGATVTDEASRKRLSLLASFDLSLRRLPAEKRRHFAWLGVLPEDASLTPAMVTTLWESDERTASETLRYLRGKALLLPGVSRPDGAPTYRLHDLLHDLARRLLTAPAEPTRADDLPGLGLSLAAAHAALLDRYQARTFNKLWHTLPDDGYAHTYLTWHMERAGQVEQIHTLLKEESAQGRNGWYEVRDRLSDVAGFLADVNRAWKLAEEKLSLRTSPIVFGRQCRYALMIASLNSLAKNIPPTLLAALVDRGVWTEARGLIYAYQIPDPKQRVEAITELARCLSNSQKDEALQGALKTAWKILSDDERAEALNRLSPYWPALIAPNRLPKTLAAAWEIENKKIRAMALIELTPYLPTLYEGDELYEQLQKVLQATQAIVDGEDLIKTLIKLAPYLPEPLKSQALNEAFTASHTIMNRDSRARRLVELTSCLPDELIDKAFQDAFAAVKKIKELKDKSKALVWIIPSLPPLLKENVLQEALAIARELPEEGSGLFENPKAEMLVSIAPYLLESYSEEALTIACAIESEGRRADVLAELAPFQPKNVIKKTLEAIREIEQEHHRNQALSKLAPCLLSRGLLPEALTVIRELPEYETFSLYGHPRTKALVAMAPYVAKELLVTEGLEIAGSIWPESDRVEAFVGLAPHLPNLLREQIFEEALLTVRGIEQEWHRAEAAKALVRLIPYLSKTLQEEAPEKILVEAMRMQGEWLQAEVLADLIPNLLEPLKGEAQQQALTAIQKMRNKRDNAKEIPKLVLRMIPDLPETLRYEMLREGLAAVRLIRDSEEKRDAFVALGPYLSGELLPEALAVIGTTYWEFPFEMRKSLTALIPHLSPELPIAVLQEALVLGLKYEHMWALTFIGPCLPKIMLQEILVDLQVIGDTDDRVKVLAELIPYLPEMQREEKVREVLEALWAIESSQVKMQILIGLIPHLPKHILHEILSMVREFEGVVERANILASLIPYLDVPDRAETLQEILRTVGPIEADERAKILASLIPYLAASEQEKIIQEIFELVGKIGLQNRVNILLGLIPNLSQSLLEEALVLARGIKRVRKFRDTDESVYAESVHRHDFTPYPRYAEVQLLAGLASKLVEPQKSEILREAFDIVHRTWMSEEKTRILLELAPTLPETMLVEALAAVQEINRAYDQAEAISGLAFYLPEHLLHEAVEMAQAIEDKPTQFQALSGVALRLAQLDRLEEIGAIKPEIELRILAIGVLRRLDEDFSKDFSEQLGRLPEPLKEKILQDILDIVPDIEDEYVSAYALAKVAPCLPEPDKRNALLRALAIARNLEQLGFGFKGRAETLKVLVPHLIKLPSTELYSLWCESLPILASHTRQDLLSDLPVLAPIILELADPLAVAEIFYAIQDVGRWWP